MFMNCNNVRLLTPGGTSPGGTSPGAALPASGPILPDGMPRIQYRILAKLADRPTDASGYAALQIPGHEVSDLDDAIEVLHDAGLLNAFFVNQAARPRFHPSSLTREGRRIYERYVRDAGA